MKRSLPCRSGAHSYSFEENTKSHPPLSRQRASDTRENPSRIVAIQLPAFQTSNRTNSTKVQCSIRDNDREPLKHRNARRSRGPDGIYPWNPDEKRHG